MFVREIIPLGQIIFALSYKRARVYRVSSDDVQIVRVVKGNLMCCRFEI